MQLQTWLPCLLMGSAAIYLMFVFYYQKAVLRMLQPSIHFSRIPVMRYLLTNSTAADNIMGKPVDETGELSLEWDGPNETEDILLEIFDQNESILLQQAEVLVDEIQVVVDGIAKSAPHTDEIFSKLKALIQPYSIFKDTEYYDAINSYVAIAVERDCGVQFSKKELDALWKE